MPKVKIIVIGAGARGNIYASYAQQQPQSCEIVGVAEPNRTRRELFAVQYNIAPDRVFSSWEEILGVENFADAAIICTQDRMHVVPAIEAMKKGYHILLEKPISPDKQECVELIRVSRRYKKKVGVCHVLRYTEFFKTLRDICLDSEKYGNIVSMQHYENVANWHHAHSFCRGNWGNSKKSAPMLLAKSCHDLDIIAWMMSIPCKSITSVGQLLHFTHKNCPEGAPEYCIEGCPVEYSCPYHAPSFYLGSHKDWARHFLDGGDPTPEAVTEALKTSDYGRCVYQCDNDVVDNQSVLIEFQNGTSCQFTMASLTERMCRESRIITEYAEIRADEGDRTISIYDFRTKKTTQITTPEPKSGHGGGDFGVMEDFVKSLIDENHIMCTSLDQSVASHLMVFAAEESRTNGGVSVDFEKFCREHGLEDGL